MATKKDDKKVSLKKVPAKEPKVKAPKFVKPTAAQKRKRKARKQENDVVWQAKNILVAALVKQSVPLSAAHRKSLVRRSFDLAEEFVAEVDRRKEALGK